jgi:hypothetical protein
VRGQDLPRRLARPEAEAALRQALLTQPEALTIIDQEFDRRAPAVAKDEQRPAKRVFGQHLPHTPGQAVDPAAKVGRLGGDPDAQARGQRDHGRVCQRLRATSAMSRLAARGSSIRSARPWRSERTRTQAGVASGKPKFEFDEGR